MGAESESTFWDIGIRNLYPFPVDMAVCLLTTCLLATSKSGTHWEPRDQGLDGGLVSSLRALL